MIFVYSMLLSSWFINLHYHDNKYCLLSQVLNYDYIFFLVQFIVFKAFFPLLCYYCVINVALIFANASSYFSLIKSHFLRDLILEPLALLLQTSLFALEACYVIFQEYKLTLTFLLVTIVSWALFLRAYDRVTF